MSRYCSLVPACEQKGSPPAIAVTNAPEPPKFRVKGTGVVFATEPRVPDSVAWQPDGTVWMTAHEARHLVSERNGGYGAIDSIRKRAANGLLRSWAKLSRKNGHNGANDVADAELPPEFWKLRVMHNDWAAGDFETLVSDHPYQSEAWHTFGVRFDRAGIEAMLAAAPTPQAPAMEGNGGGRPHALDWEAATLEMAGRFYRGDLKPQSVADVIRAIQQWAGQPDGGPNDSTVRPHAKRIFDALKAWEAD